MEELLLFCTQESQNREAAEQKLMRLEEADLGNYINSLVEVCSTSSNSLAISLALIFLYRAFTKITISEYGQDIFNQVAEFSFGLISNANDNVSQQSASLFGLVAGNLIRSDLSPEIIGEISGNIKPDGDPRVVHYILVALRELLSSTQLECTAQTAVFTALMNLSANPVFAADIVDTLIVMADDLSLAVS